MTTVHTVKSKGKILQNFVAFSEYMNFIKFGVVDPPFTYKMVDNSKFNIKLKFGVVNDFIDNKPEKSFRLISSRWEFYGLQDLDNED